MLSVNQMQVKTNCDLTRVTAPALATGCMFSRAHHWCHVFKLPLRLPAVTITFIFLLGGFFWHGDFAFK